MVVAKISASTVSICQIRAICSETLEVEIFQRKKGSYKNTGKRLRIGVRSCFPSGFRLTHSKNIPLKIAEKIRHENLIVV
jgi:hypothetical protein